MADYKPLFINTINNASSELASIDYNDETTQLHAAFEEFRKNTGGFSPAVMWLTMASMMAGIPVDVIPRGRNMGHLLNGFNALGLAFIEPSPEETGLPEVGDILFFSGDDNVPNRINVVVEKNGRKMNIVGVGSDGVWRLQSTIAATRLYQFRISPRYFLTRELSRRDAMLAAQIKPAILRSITTTMRKKYGENLYANCITGNNYRSSIIRCWQRDYNNEFAEQTGSSIKLTGIFGGKSTKLAGEIPVDLTDGNAHAIITPLRFALYCHGYDPKTTKPVWDQWVSTALREFISSRRLMAELPADDSSLLTREVWKSVLTDWHW